MRHFKNRKLANAYARSLNAHTTRVNVYKKKVGMPRRFTHPYMVGSYLEWLNFNY